MHFASLRTLSPLAFALGLGSACFNPQYSNPGYYCMPDSDPACPTGSECQLTGGEYRCVKPSGGGGGGGGGALDITKSGTYNGTTQDPMLDALSDCTDQEALEPNNDFADAVAVPTTVNGGGGWIGNLAICPKGKKDVDFYEIDTSSASQSSITLKVEIKYDIQYGDLDVALVDGEGNMLASDGSAKTDGCVVASVGNGKYYAGVIGADGAVNRYQLRVRAYSTPQSCSTTGDMK